MPTVSLKKMGTHLFYLRICQTKIIQEKIYMLCFVLRPVVYTNEI